jgi:hypothetical protein
MSGLCLYYLCFGEVELAEVCRFEPVLLPAVLPLGAGPPQAGHVLHQLSIHRPLHQTLYCNQELHTIHSKSCQFTALCIRLCTVIKNYILSTLKAVNSPPSPSDSVL